MPILPVEATDRNIVPELLGTASNDDSLRAISTILKTVILPDFTMNNDDSSPPAVMHAAANRDDTLSPVSTVSKTVIFPDFAVNNDDSQPAVEATDSPPPVSTILKTVSMANNDENTVLDSP